MQTQGISLQVSAMKSMSSGKSTKVSKSTFDSFMSQNASKADTKVDANVSQTKSAKQQNVQNEKDTDNTKDAFETNKLTVNSKKAEKTEIDEVDIENVETQIVSFLKDTFGLSDEDVTDLLEQLGITAADLAFAMNQNAVNVNPVNVENIKAFIMDVHGVEDENLFLVSDKMSNELNEVMNGIQDILSKELGIDLNHPSKEDNVRLQSFAEKFAQTVNSSNTKAANQVDETADANDAADTIMTSEQSEEIQVVVETSSESDASDLTGKSQEKMPEHVDSKSTESPINTFVDRLSQSFDRVGQAETANTRVVMNNIVEQVVNHVKIRVLPQTTSMELQLNPESLGRVNLHVTSNNGTATATLTVQNEVAKEALESQISVLKENLESQGLKVDSVEVNVSEFAFKNPEDSNSNQEQKKKGSNRRFRFDAGNDILNEEQTSETSKDRQDGNSVVDYTA